MSDAVVDAEVVEEPQELVHVAHPTTLFRTDDPVEVLARAKRVADALAPVIRSAGLVQNISGKDYLNVEAWQTLGSQVGVTPVVVSSRRVHDPEGWEARCEARSLDGRTLGAADSMCLRTEERWKEAEDFEVRSMAQTRAMSRALASVLRFIPTLAGFSGTPAEEMQGRAASGPSKPSDKQLDFLVSLAKQHGADANDQDTIRAYAAVNLTGGKQGTTSKTIELLKDGDNPGDVVARLAKAAHEWQAKAYVDLPADGAE